jgi:Fuc2NAc and GlcNAc transferase
MIPLIALVVTSFALSWLLVGLIKHYLAAKLLDIPNQRSSHTQPTPRGGGLGFILAFAMTTTISPWFGLPSYLNWYLVLLPLIIVGIVDDYRDVPAKVRYLVQLITAISAIALLGFVSFPGLADSQVAGIILTIIAITALINFYNFLDGLDGLVASCALVELAWFALDLQQPGLWLLVGALGGFLWWNWSPAKIFMGDIGSTFLGAIIAMVILSSKDQPFYLWSAFAITLPLVSDAIYTLVRRLLNQENIFKAHRSHIYQRLQQSGWSHPQVSLSYAFFSVLMGALVFFGGVIGVIIGLVLIFLAIAITEFYLQKQKNCKKILRENSQGSHNVAK